ncbi:Hpt domain-containing protein [Kiloniella laminariae]|uniref:Hpt domain-containing protein n=1 Tax=Kiloniella laminariae TaxID=454162 RepID=UPI0003765652|nr:Hpt domain-containing protein [Kiloniella laminariae]
MPTNNLKSKVPTRGGPDLEDIVASAESALQGMEQEYEVWVAEDVEKISKLLEKARESSPAPEALIDEIQGISHDIKGQAGTFNFPLLTETGKSLCKLIQKDMVAACQRLDLIEAHVDAMRIIISQRIKGSGGAVGKSLTSALNQAVEKVLSEGGKK